MTIETDCRPWRGTWIIIFASFGEGYKRRPVPKARDGRLINQKTRGPLPLTAFFKLAVVVASVAAHVASAGCRTTSAVTRAENQISRAVGFRDAIRFETRRQPDDAGAEPPGSLSLEDAIERSLRHDTQIQVALSHVRAAEADLQQASLLPNPVLAVSFRYSNIHTAPITDVSLAGDLLAI